MWLGHARNTPEPLIGTASGTVKAWAIRRLPEGQQWDGERIRQIVGSPKNWRIDAPEEPQLVEIEDRSDPELNPQLRDRVGMRTGEKRSIYLSQKDFEKYGYSDGCPGCRDLASGKKRKNRTVAPYNVACRSRMDEAIQAADPDRWERFMLRQRQAETGRQRGAQGQRGAEPAVAEEESARRSPAVPADGPDAEAGAPSERRADEDDGWDAISRVIANTTPARKTQEPSNPFQSLGASFDRELKQSLGLLPSYGTQTEKKQDE